MTSYRYAALIAALTLVSCTDEKAAEILAPEPAVEAGIAPSPDFNAMPGNGSSVCVSSQADLAAIEAQLAEQPTAELQETKDALAAITADVCS